MNETSDAARVERIEALVGVSLPEDYRRCLLTDDLDLPSDPEFWVPHPDGRWIDGLHGLFGASQVLSLLECETDLVRQGYRDFPECMIPIADNGCGDWILLSLRDSNFGSIHYMFHEEAHPEADGDAGVYRLADSYTQWFDSLGKIEESQ